LGLGLLILGRHVDLRRLVETLLEGLHALAKAAHDLGQAAGPEHDEHDDEHDDELAESHAEHASIIGFGRRPGKPRFVAPSAGFLYSRRACGRTGRRTNASCRSWKSPVATSATSVAQSARTSTGCASALRSAFPKSTRSPSRTSASRSSTTS